MDMRQFAGSSFITVETLRDGPREEVIVSVEPGKYDKPVATFESGAKFSLNVTNVNTLIKAYGPNDQDWIDCTVELYIGDVKYNGEDSGKRLGAADQPAEAGRGAHAGAEARRLQMT